MRPETEKKLISFAKSDLINRILKDKSETENITESAIVEKILLERFLTENSDINRIISNHIFTEDSDLSQAIQDFVWYFSIGEDGNPRQGDLRPIISFVINQAIEPSSKAVISRNDELLSRPTTFNSFSNTDSHIDSMIFMLESYMKENELGEAEKTSLNRDICELREHYRLFNENPEEIEILAILSSIINYWDILKKWTFVYRLIMNLVSYSNIVNNAENRIRFCELMKDISKSWK